MRAPNHLLGLTLLTALFIAAPTQAQLTTPTVAVEQPVTQLPPEIVSLVTKDGVQLVLTHYPALAQKGQPLAKQVTPVILLHDYKDTRAIFDSLAARLQAVGNPAMKRAGFDVITVDLRAHGDSTKQTAANGAQLELDAAKLGTPGFEAMVGLDLEAIRSWLVAKNEDGVLSLNKLCLVGAGMGANIAANWAARDWATPPLATGKQGQDVKALVLISPRWTYRGLTMQAPMQLAPLKQNVSWLLLYGGDDPEVRADVRRMHEQLLRFHPEQPGGGTNGLAALTWPSKLQGGRLLSQSGPGVEEEIVRFLTTQVADREFPWITRREQKP